MTVEGVTVSLRSSFDIHSLWPLPLTQLHFVSLVVQDRFDLTLSHYEQVRLPSFLTYLTPATYLRSPFLFPIRLRQVCTSLSGHPPVLSVIECATMQAALPRCKEMMKVRLPSLLAPCPFPSARSLTQLLLYPQTGGVRGPLRCSGVPSSLGVLLRQDPNAVHSNGIEPVR